jgi:hypothetical protein
MKIVADSYFREAVIRSATSAGSVVQKVARLVKQGTGVTLPGGAISRTFHDSLLKELKKNRGFSDSHDAVSDFAYRGERWELKTSQTKETIGINRVNIPEKVKLLLVNWNPEEGAIRQIRILDSRDRYFAPASPGTQIRSLNALGKKKAVRIFP